MKLEFEYFHISTLKDHMKFDQNKPDNIEKDILAFDKHRGWHQVTAKRYVNDPDRINYFPDIDGYEFEDLTEVLYWAESPAMSI